MHSTRLLNYYSTHLNDGMEHKQCCEKCLHYTGDADGTTAGWNECSNTVCPCHFTPPAPKSGGDWEKEFDEKFLYWVVLGSTLNDGSKLRWNVGEGKLPNIEEIKSFIRSTLNERTAYVKRRIAETMNRLGIQQIELYNGKLPFVVFEGKASEEEKIAIYRMALKDFEKALLDSLSGGKGVSDETV